MIKLADLEFTNKQEARVYISSILNSYSPGSALNERDFAIILDVLRLHPRCDAKIGCGVRAIHVQMDLFKKTKGFWISRHDGSLTDFSFYKCLASKEATKEAQIMAAARFAVRQQIAEYKRKNNIQEADAVDVHHAKPLTFKKIVLDFLKFKGLSFKDVDVIGFDDGDMRRQFKDKNLEKEFSNYHRKIAQLQIVPTHDHRKFKR